MSEVCFTISIYINPFESLVVLLSYTIFYSNSSSHLNIKSTQRTSISSWSLPLRLLPWCPAPLWSWPGLTRVNMPNVVLPTVYVYCCLWLSLCVISKSITGMQRDWLQDWSYHLVRFFERNLPHTPGPFTDSTNYNRNCNNGKVINYCPIFYL